MTKKPVNIPASVHSRLLNLARKKNRTFGELLQFYGLERFLYRLSLSEYKNQYILKGAMMFLHWTDERSRPTRDIDLLKFESVSETQILKAFREICAIKVAEDDGVNFDSKSIKVQAIIPEQGQRGIRVTFKGHLGKAEMPMQVDVAFGDIVIPSVKTVKLKTLLDYPSPVLKGYSIETAIAEKFHAITKLGLLNSRLKDFYDIWYIFEFLSIDKKVLVEAIRQTFKRRKTVVPPSLPVGFTDEYWKRNKEAWLVMLKRNGLKGPSMQEVIDDLAKAFTEIIRALSN